MPQVHGKRMIDRRRVTAGTAALAASLAAPRGVRAETAAEFYRGKTVRVLVGSPPGGGYDIYARLVTPMAGSPRWRRCWCGPPMG
jgi:tripartite-type tricarboxylate transporter receptor subunit TctC